MKQVCDLHGQFQLQAWQISYIHILAVFYDKEVQQMSFT